MQTMNRWASNRIDVRMHSRRGQRTGVARDTPELLLSPSYHSIPPSSQGLKRQEMPAVQYGSHRDERRTSGLTGGGAIDIRRHTRGAGVDSGHRLVLRTRSVS